MTQFPEAFVEVRGLVAVQPLTTRVMLERQLALAAGSPATVALKNRIPVSLAQAILLSVIGCSRSRGGRSTRKPG
jgi:hypothetical protein